MPPCWADSNLPQRFSDVQFDEAAFEAQTDSATV